MTVSTKTVNLLCKWSPMRGHLWFLRRLLPFFITTERTVENFAPSLQNNVQFRLDFSSRSQGTAAAPQHRQRPVSPSDKWRREETEKKAESISARVYLLICLVREASLWWILKLNLPFICWLQQKAITTCHLVPLGATWIWWKTLQQIQFEARGPLHTGRINSS